MIERVQPSRTSLGWIGAGVMGAAMCGPLLHAGYAATLHLVLLFGLMLSGCASSQGFDREAMRATLSHETASHGDARASITPTERPAVSVPVRLALYFVQRDFPAHHTIQKAEWASTDKELLEQGLAPLRSEGIVTDLFLLVDATIKGSDARKIRQAALRYGADLVMILDGVAAVDRYNNGYASLYPTLVGAWLAPGTVSEALFMMEGEVWDVRTERLFASQAAEGQAQTVGTAIAVEDRQVLDRAKKAALAEFGKRMADAMHRFKEATPPVRDRLR